MYKKRFPTEKKYEAIFVSDVHLSHKRKATKRAFISFINSIAIRAKNFYMLGDIFSFWIGNDYEVDIQEDFFNALNNLHNTGTKIYYMHGNRDFLFHLNYGKFGKFKNLISILDDPCVIELSGKRIVLSHGDMYCSSDKKYQIYRKIVRCKIIQKCFLSLPLRLRLKIANFLSHDRDFTQYYINLDDEMINKVLFDCRASIFMHGHIHRENIRYINGIKKDSNVELDSKNKVITLGEWVGARPSAYFLTEQNEDFYKYT